VLPCPVCRYDLTHTPRDAPCPECGLASPERANAFRHHAADRRRSLRIFALLMVPAWLFAAINAVGYATAFWILALPRATPIAMNQHPMLDALGVAAWACTPTLPASALGLIILPCSLIPALRRFDEHDNPRRVMLLLIAALPALALTVLILFEPAPSAIFSWLPQ
jgi:hypothetical protein